MGNACSGRVVLVTGASRGIGAAAARRFGAEGASVAVVARSLEPGSGGHLAGSLRETAAAITGAGGVALPIAADLSDPACDRAAIVKQIEAALGPVDILVNNAAACFYLSLDETSERRLRVAYEVNVITPYLLTKAVVPSMRDRGEGWIVNITSAIVDPTPSPQQARSSTYAPSKAALDRLTISLAAELAGTGIAVHAVAPVAAVATEGATAMMNLPEGALEPMDTMVDAIIALATCDPAVDSGLVTRSKHYLKGRA
jgi:NAD(P)-dependent dehydrogenase (short-subunit alcohol dehydrogenase family)